MTDCKEMTLNCIHVDFLFLLCLLCLPDLSSWGFKIILMMSLDLQATLKKKLMKEGLLDEKGKPNDKTPSDWHSRYKEFTHYGQSSSNGSPLTSHVNVEESSIATGGEEESEEKQKKKKKKKSKEPKEEEDDD